MNSAEIKRWINLYEHELKNHFLSFWLPRCEDSVNGGFFNCFDNYGKQLVSKDKYCWSQGRFVWIFSKLASTEAPIFSKSERNEFLRLARQGVDFLKKHCLLKDSEQPICAFLLDEYGKPKQVDGCDRLDMSIYADCFVVCGLAKYAAITKDTDTYAFAKQLYLSIRARIQNSTFETLPYPLSKEYRAHGIPMIQNSMAQDVYRASQVLDPDFCAFVLADIQTFTDDVLGNFVDENNALREVITKDNAFFNETLGTHMNPGHTIEDVWFMLDASVLLQKQSKYSEKLSSIALKTLETGWDKDFGGILHFCSLHGTMPTGAPAISDNEAMAKQLTGWGDKLWWVHSEALYTTLRCYNETDNPEFLAWHDKIAEYAFRVYPNRDPAIHEWIQILNRKGEPLDAVVALPVKDPYHIIRNLILILELLYQMNDAT